MEIQKRFTDRASLAIIKPKITLPFEPNLNAYNAWENELPVLNPKISDQQSSEANAALVGKQEPNSENKKPTRGRAEFDISGLRLIPIDGNTHHHRDKPT
jgi:hypothetical protein